MPRRELPNVDERRCTSCGDCVRVCPTDSLLLARDREVVVIPQNCIGCTLCEVICPAAAIAMQLRDW